MKQPIEAILLVNLGTPESYQRSDVKRYLNEFLSDPLVVDSPRWWWLPVLRGIILPIRSGASAALYRSVWLDKGSPLRVYTESLAHKLRARTTKKVEWAMRYGHDNIKNKLNEFKEKGIHRIKVIPLFPQFSRTTIGTVILEIENYQKNNPEFFFEVQQGYAQHPEAIAAWADQLSELRKENKNHHVLFSFHGLPQRYIRDGDPYLDECLATAHAIADKISLENWSIAFQSQFGPEKWLEPSTDEALINLAEQQRGVIVFAPGFSADCLETLEELDENYRQLYKAYGGKEWLRVPCLNDSKKAVQLIGMWV